MYRAAVIFIVLLATIAIVPSSIAGQSTTHAQHSTNSVLPPDDSTVQSTGTVEVVIRFTDVPRATVASSEDPVRTLHTAANRTQSSFIQYAASTQGISIVEEFWLTNAVLVEVNTTRTPLEALAAREGVRRIHDNFQVMVADTPTVGNSVSESIAPATVPPRPADYTYGLTQIDVPSLWHQYNTTGGNTTVAVLDTGVDVSNHSDLQVGSDGWYDVIHGRNTPYDDNGHGTHVSGTVVGTTTATGTNYGVAPNATLLHAKVFPGSGSTSFANITTGMQWAVAHDAETDVISMSLGASGYYEEFIEPVQNARSAGVVVVAASGNRGPGTSSSPANIYETLAVGATDKTETVPALSSGETVITSSAWKTTSTTATWPDEYVIPDIAAPGLDVKSAVSGGGYGIKSGTSMATPHVAGTAALLQSATNETLTPAEIETAIRSTAHHPDGAAAVDTRYGQGIVDADAAADSVATPASFQLTSVTAPTTFAADVNYSITASVRNAGDPVATQMLSYRLVRPNGTTVVDRGQTTTLAGGATTNVTFELPANVTAGQYGDYTHQVSSRNASTTRLVTVGAPLVAGPGDVNGDGNAARDLDGDGLFEDVNGDSTFDLLDVQTLFAFRNQVTTASKLDFNGDTTTDLFDVQRLFWMEQRNGYSPA